MPDQKLLDAAIKTRDDYIKNHPELKTYQRDLEIALSQLDDPLDRLQVIVKKIGKNADKLRGILTEIEESLNT